MARTRRLVRWALRRGLRVLLSDRTAHRLRWRFQDSSGWRRQLLRPLVRVLRHAGLEGRPAFTLSRAGPIRMTSVDSSLTQLLFWYGEAGYEAPLLAWWRWLVPSASSVLEVGCNIGLYSVIGATTSPVTRYRAVDANPEACQITHRNLELNGCHHVEVINAAVIGEDRAFVELELPMREAPAAPSTAHVRSGELRADPSRATVKVPARRAVTLVDDADLIKLDVEGLEADVLADAMPLILANRATLVIEVLPGADRLLALLAGLIGDSYQAFVPEHGGFRELGPLHSADELGARDLILVHRRRTIPWFRDFVLG